MNRMTTLMLIVLLQTSLVYAQTSPGAQAGASAQSQAGTNAQTQRSGAQASGAGSASTQANASASAGRSGVTLSEGSTVNATLQSTLDAKKSKPGDRVEARTTQDVKQDGKVVLAKGTRLVGHVTRAQARGAGESKSALGVAFDNAQLPNGQQVPLNLAIQALAATQSAAYASTDDAGLLATGGGATSATGGSGRASGGGLIGGTVRTATGTVGDVAGGISNTAGAAVGSTVNTTAPSAGSMGGLNAAGVLTSNSRGVFGLEGLSLDSAASSAADGSMIVSPTRDVHLASGTQMVLRAAGQVR